MHVKGDITVIPNQAGGGGGGGGAFPLVHYKSTQGGIGLPADVATEIITKTITPQGTGLLIWVDPNLQTQFNGTIPPQRHQVFLDCLVTPPGTNLHLPTFQMTYRDTWRDFGGALGNGNVLVQTSATRLWGAQVTAGVPVTIAINATPIAFASTVLEKTIAIMECQFEQFDIEGEE